MAQFIPNVAPDSLKDKVVVMTGGSNGIGAALVEECCKAGANVCFGDFDTTAGEQHAQKLAAGTTESPKPRVLFVETDVSDYQSNITLFQTALDTYGQIDHAVAVAGILEYGSWFDVNLNLETVKAEPSKKTIDVNLVGSLYFAHIASVYLRENRDAGADRSLTLISSSAGFKSNPGATVYQASKHGVLGVMRSLRQTIALPSLHNIRVNAVCPWVSDTSMTTGFTELWVEKNLPVNTPEGIGNAIVGLMCEEGMSGKGIFAEGNRFWEFEDNLERLQPQWLGEETSKTFNIGQDLFASIFTQRLN